MWDHSKIEWIDVELTSFCNIRCKACLRETSKYREEFINKDLISLETIKEKFKKEDWPNLKRINFCGSVDEPISHPNFFDIIRYFADWGIYINVATNGSLRTEKWWSDLASIMPLKNHNVTFGIDGVDSTSEIYRSGSKFKKVEKNFRAFIAAGGRAQWQFIVFDHNEHQLEEAKQRAKEEGFHNFKTIWSSRHDQKDVSHKKVEREENSCIDCKFQNEQRIFINHKGDVIPCCYLNNFAIEYHSGRPASSNNFLEMVERHGGSSAYSLYDHEIKDIVDGPVFKEIEDRWTSDDPLSRCVDRCKSNRRDIWDKEKL